MDIQEAFIKQLKGDIKIRDDLKFITDRLTPKQIQDAVVDYEKVKKRLEQERGRIKECVNNEYFKICARHECPNTKSCSTFLNLHCRRCDRYYCEKHWDDAYDEYIHYDNYVWDGIENEIYQTDKCDNCLSGNLCDCVKDGGSFRGRCFHGEAKTACQ